MYFPDSIKYPDEIVKMPSIDFTTGCANKTDVKYRLFTELSDNNGKLLTEETVCQTDINRNLPSKFLIHGWSMDETSFW